MPVRALQVHTQAAEASGRRVSQGSHLGTARPPRTPVGYCVLRTRVDVWAGQLFRTDSSASGRSAWRSLALQ